MDLCKKCPKEWDCDEPCLQVIAWQELSAEDRIPDKSYVPKGIAPLLTNAERNRLKSHWDNTNNSGDSKKVGSIDE